MDEIQAENLGGTETTETAEVSDELVSQESEVQDSKANVQGEQQITETEPEQEWDWTKDERHARMWKEDPNGMYKSYRNLEGEYEKVKSLKNDYTSLTSKFEERGLKVDELDNYFNEYKELKDPNNPRNQDMAILEDFMSDSETEQKIGNFFRELQTEKLQRQFPGMNQEQIQSQVKMTEELSELKKAEEQRQYESKTKEYTQQILGNTKKMVEFASDRGFEVTDNIKNEVLDYCTKNQIPPNAIFATFLEKYGDKVFEAQENKMRDNYTKKLNGNDKTIIPSAKKTGGASNGTSSAENKNRLNDIIRNSLNKLKT